MKERGDGRSLLHRYLARGPLDPQRPIACVVVLPDADERVVRCVRSLSAQVPHPQIVVIGFGDRVPRELIENCSDEARIIYHGGPLTRAAACNLGISATSAPAIAFLCADQRVDAGWVARRIEVLGQVECEHGAVTTVDAGSPTTLAESLVASAAGLAAGTRWIACSRSVLERFGGFDESAQDHETEFLERIETAAAIRESSESGVRRIPVEGVAVRLKSFYAGVHRLVFATGVPSFPGMTGRIVRSFAGFRAEADAAGRRRAALALPALVACSAAVGVGQVTGARRRRLARMSQRAETGRVIALLQVRDAMRYLPGYLANLEGKVQGVIALDDGSGDGTAALLRDHPLVMRLIEKPRHENHEWDEPGNRRKLVEAARQLGAGWVIALDADERLPSDFHPRLLRTLAAAKRRDIAAFSLWLRELWNAPNTYRVDGVWGSKRVARLFDASRGNELDGDRFHGQWAPADSRLRRRYVNSDLEIFHLAMIHPRDREARRRRYEQLDPNNDWQSIGYAYLTDENGCVCRAIDPAAMYEPVHIEE